MERDNVSIEERLRKSSFGLTGEATIRIIQAGINLTILQEG